MQGQSLTDEAIRRIGSAKAAIDHGFSRVGPELRSDSRLDAWLFASASRAVALADAIVLLCKRDHANEAIFLLRELAESAFAVRWVAADSAEARLAEHAAEGDGAAAWDAGRLEFRMRSAGLPAEETLQWLESLRGLAAGYARSAPAALPWAHAFAAERGAPTPPEEVLDRAARALAHVLRGLRARWPEAFAAGEDA